MIEQRERSAAEGEEHASDFREALRESWPGLAFGIFTLLLLVGSIVYLLISLF